MKKYEILKESLVQFTPRFYSFDYFSILFTLDYLDKEYNRSFTKFLVEQINRHKEKEDLIGRLIFSLYVLSYKNLYQLNKEDIGNKLKIEQKSSERTVITKQILTDKFEEEYLKFKNNQIYSQKRTWCALRDYFKSPEFKGYFIDSLREEGLNEDVISSLFCYNNLSQFELPGDVWNNNSKFRNCILEGTEYSDSKRNLNKILRDYFEKNKDDLDGCSPEQFDISFDFVPRMCQINNCDICPIGYLKSETENNFLKTCANNRNLFCTVGLSDCNYKGDCQGNECQLLELINLKQKHFKSNK